MAKAKETKKPTPKAREVRTIDQLTLARQIAGKFGLKLSDVMNVVEEEQKLTMEFVRMGYHVIKKNYLTLELRSYGAKPNWTCPLDGKKYNLPENKRIIVRVGEGFKKYVSDGKVMPEKLCRFVQTPPAPKAVGAGA